MIDPLTSTPTVQIDEGILTDISITGDDPKSIALAERFLVPLANGLPLQIDQVERRILILSDQAGVSLDTNFERSPNTAGTRLNANLQQRRGTGSVSLDNIPRRPGDSIRLLGQHEFYSTIGSGDLLRVVGVLTREPDDSVGVAGSLFYRIPVGNDGAFADFSAGTARSSREFLATRQEIEQRGLHASAAIGYPLVRTINRYDYLVGEYQYLDGESDFGNTRTSRSVHVMRAYWLGGRYSESGTVVEFSLSGSAGFADNAGGLVPANNDNAFAHLRAEAGVAVPLANELIFRAEADGQIALTNLPEIEHFFLGHLPVVRGYAQSEAEAESGAALSLQLERPVELSPTIQATPFAFVDVGITRGEPAQGSTFGDEMLASVGAGVTVSSSSQFSLQGWIALPLADGPLTRAGNPAFYLRLTKGW